MTDPAVIVDKIIGIAINIKDAVETVRENKEECRDIEKLVCRVSDLLSLLKESELMRHRVIGGPLEDLGDAISRAHDVVAACQRKNNLCFFCKARTTAKKLSQVKTDISEGMMLAIFASHASAAVFVATEGQQSAVSVNVFPVRTHQPPPLSEHLPSRLTVFVDDDLQPCYPDDVHGNDDIRSSTPSSPPRCPPTVNIAPPLSKHLPPLPTPPSRPLATNPIASIGLTKPGHLPRPSSHVPHSASQNPVDISTPISGLVSNPSSENVCSTYFHQPSESNAQYPPLPGLRKFSLTELKNATQNFSEKNKIGSNHFGTVYKGMMHSRLLVAIKKFLDPPSPLVARLTTELHLASKLQTKDVDALRNNKYIVKIMGYGHEIICEDQCRETHVFLVEELLLNGNMGKIIYGEYRLHWSSLFRIIQGLAQGLNCLHEQNIVHRNVGPAIVLLDSNMNPKITDFGIARILEKSTLHDKNIEGTVGYMPPEYILEGILSIKYDVYSFGVTILETISSMCRSEPARHHASIPWAWNVREDEQMDELFVPSLFEKYEIIEIKRCLEIGLLCTQSERAERPTMMEVLDMLNGKIGLGIPKQPEYTKYREMTSKADNHKVKGWRKQCAEVVCCISKCCGKETKPDA